MQLTPVVVVFALAGCRQVLGLEDPTLVVADAPAVDAEQVDAAVPADAALPVAWSSPRRVLADMQPQDDDPSLTGDQLELYLDRSNLIYVSRRMSAVEPWPAPTPVAELDDPGSVEGTPEISLDGLTIVFASNRAPSAGSFDVWQATRTSRQAAWSAPTRIAALSSAEDDVCGGIRADGLVAVLARRPAVGGDFDLLRATRASTSTAWSAPAPIAALNVGPSDTSPNLAGPEQTLYFASNRDGDLDIYVAELASDDYASAVQVPGLASAAIDEDPWVSPDERTIYFASTREGGMSQLFFATR